MGYRIAGPWIDSVRILLSVADIELPVFSGRYDSMRSFRSPEYTLKFGTGDIVSINRSVYTYGPWLPGRIPSVTEANCSTLLHHQSIRSH